MWIGGLTWPLWQVQSRDGLFPKPRGRGQLKRRLGHHLPSGRSAHQGSDGKWAPWTSQPSSDEDEAISLSQGQTSKPSRPSGLMARAGTWGCDRGQGMRLTQARLKLGPWPEGIWGAPAETDLGHTACFHTGFQNSQSPCSVRNLTSCNFFH